MGPEQIVDLHERVARLEKGAEVNAEVLSEIRSDVRTIRTSLDQMSGGKKAFFAVYAALGAVLTIAINLIGGWWSAKLH